MRVHCLGVGSIGSLIATNLASLSNTPQVRLILRRKALAAALTSSTESSWTSPFPPSVSPGPHVSLTVERNGLARRVDGLEVELTSTRQDVEDRSRTLIDGRGSSEAYRSKKYGDLVRNDPISTLIITTKSPQTIPAIRSLLPRLSSRSTIVLCQNGMGVLEGMLNRYWPDDVEGAPGLYGAGGRPSFICATTTHGVWRKGSNHFVHAGVGDIKFGIVPNSAVLSALSSIQAPMWGDDSNNPILNPRSLTSPTLDHLPLTSATVSLRETVAALLESDLRASWLPLPTLQVAQLQKLAVNTSVNCLTALLGVHNGALVGSRKARALVCSVTEECSAVFAAHIAREEGRWTPPPLGTTEELDLLDTAASTSSSTQSPAPQSSSSSSHPPPPPLPESHPLSANSLADYTLRVLFSTSTNLSSTLQDILSTEPSSAFAPSRTEIDFINGYVVALGTRYRVHTPVVETLGRLVGLKEEMLRVGAVDRVVESRLTNATRRVSPPARPLSDQNILAQRRLGGGGGQQLEVEKKKAHVRAEQQRALRDSRFQRDRRIGEERLRRSSG